MDKNEIKSFIAEKVSAGLSLSQIQDELKAAGVKMTFMELRLIASEIESDVFKSQEKQAEPRKEEAPAADLPQDDAADEMADGEETLYPRPPAAAQQAPAAEDAAPAADQKLRGKTSVSLSKIQRPGYLASGSVTFGSGASGEWMLDQMGRLGFEKLEGKPDEQDIQEFQLELRKAFGA